MLVLTQPPPERSQLILLALVILLAMLAVPIRREYSFGPLDSKATPAYAAYQPAYEQTDVHYGAPFGWLTLSKKNNPTNHQQLHSQTTVDKNKLFIDLLTWCLLVALYILVKGLADLRSRKAKSA